MPDAVVKTIFGPFDKERARRFLATYQEALGKRQETFQFEFAGGQWGEVLTKLAKYMVEHFESEGLLDNAQTGKDSE